MDIKKIAKKTLDIFLQIIKSKQGIMLLLVFVILEAGALGIILFYGMGAVSGVLLFVVLSALISELILSLLIKYKIIYLRFLYFLDFICKKKTIEDFPQKEVYPDFYYYASNPFYHLAPESSAKLKLKNVEINSLGFRGEEKDWKNLTNYYIYLSGDCQFFERHLELTNTFAYFLETNLNKEDNRNIIVLNAGSPHYTLLHCLNRLIIDLNRIRPHLIILTAGINDVLVFIHSKNGEVLPDYTNLYKPFDKEMVIEKFLSSPILRYSKLIQLYKYFLYTYILKKRMLGLDDYALIFTENYNTYENIECSKRLFTTKYFENYLQSYISICQTFDIPLILTTNNYNSADMKGPARSFTASGIDRVNLIIKKTAEKHNLPVFDYQGKFITDSTKVFNKWHYTKNGNKLRAELISNFILKQRNLGKISGAYPEGRLF